MSAVTMNSGLEKTALNNSKIGPFKYLQELLANRPYHCFEVVKSAGDFLINGLHLTGAMVLNTHKGLVKLVNTENLIFFAQDVAALPEESRKLGAKISGWWNGSTTFLTTMNQVRKFTGHIGSTVGDYVGSVAALKDLKITVGGLDFLSERVGNIGSAIGAGSRLVDSISGDNIPSTPHQLEPALAKVRQPIEQSKVFWDATRDVSILALSVLCIGLGGGAAVPALVMTGFSASILAGRMLAFYNEARLKALDASYPQLKASEKVITAA